LPIIAYHNLSVAIKTSDDLNTAPDKFRSDLIELKKAGYTAIFFRDIIGYYKLTRTFPVYKNHHQHNNHTYAGNQNRARVMYGYDNRYNAGNRAQYI